MSADIIAFAIVFVVGLLAGVQLEKANTKERRERWKARNQRNGKGKVQAGPWTPKADSDSAKLPDAADQLRTVMKADFKAQPLLNKSEARLFKAMDKMVIEMRRRAGR